MVSSSGEIDSSYGLVVGFIIKFVALISAVIEMEEIARILIEGGIYDE